MTQDRRRHGDPTGAPQRGSGAPVNNPTATELDRHLTDEITRGRAKGESVAHLIGARTFLRSVFGEQT
jgi:hypothetical protein